MEERIIGLDFGSRTVGVAVTDPLMLTALGVETIRREKPTKLRRTLARIESLMTQYGAVKIVLGYPRCMDGTEGDRCAATLSFKEMLEKCLHTEVVLWDERLTTVEAYQIMSENGTPVQKQRECVDEVAAVLILQDYMNAQKRIRP